MKRLTQPAPYTGGNLLIDGLPDVDRAEVVPYLSVRYDESPGVLRNRDRAIDALHFPIDAVYSIVVEVVGGNSYEVDTIGRYGFVGAELLVGAAVSARTVLCQVGGRVAQLPPDRFNIALGRSEAFRTAARESVRRQWFVSQQTVACNFAHSLVQRCARWMLMTHDQVGRDEFPMRVEYLSIMLGVPAGAVREPTDVLAALGSIEYRNGIVTLLSREALISHACDCYTQQQIAALIREA